MQLPEFSRIINKDCPGGRIVAGQSELRNLASRFDLQKIQKLELSYEIHDKYLKCHMNSEVIKDSENIEIIEIDEDFNIILAHSHEEDDLANSKEDIEILDDENNFDIGEIAAQYLSIFVYMQ